MLATLWNTLFYYPIMNGLLFLYGLFGENLGIAIIVLTLILRIILFPLMRSQYESAKKLRSLQPMMEKLKKKYERNPQKLQEEQVALYRKSGYNPLGCLFSILLPFPFLIAIYQAITAFSKGTDIVGVYPIVADFLHNNGKIVIETMFFGLDLSKAFRPVARESGYLSLEALPYLLMVVLVGLSQFFSTKFQQKLMGADEVKKEEDKKDEKKKNGKDDKAGQPDMSSMMKDVNKSMQYTFPAIIAFAAIDFPSAVSLYWIMQSWIPVLLNNLYDKFKTKK